jgi:hypothetical protein
LASASLFPIPFGAWAKATMENTRLANRTEIVFFIMTGLTLGA